MLKRPCTIRFRDTGTEPVGHIDADGRDLNPLDEGFTESRCIGACECVVGGGGRMVGGGAGGGRHLDPLTV